MMHASIMLAGKGLAAHLTAGDLATRTGLDVLAVLVLVGLLYRRRRPLPEMPLTLTALNIGLFAAMTAISAGKFPAGVGFGLFGILSLVRLRSAAFTVKDVAYTFITLVIALVNGLPQRGMWVIVFLDVFLLAAVLVVDDPRAHRPTRTMKITLDRLYDSTEEVHADVAARLGGELLALEVDEVDYVRETTRVSARYAVEEPVQEKTASIPRQRDGADDLAPLSDGTST